MISSYRYDDAFFDYIEEGARRSATKLVGMVANTLRPQSVVDIGCGRGIWVREWMRAGVDDAFGVDGEYVRVDRLAIPPDHFLPRNLSEPFDLGRRFALVQSLEVAEHLEETYADAFVDGLCRHAQLVLFSAAVPGQGGERHVNEQPLEYWRQKFGARGYHAFDWLRPRLAEARDVEPWYRYNSLLFATEQAIAGLPPEVRKARLPPHEPVPDVAPVSWRLRNALMRRLPKRVVNQLSILKHKILNLARR